MNDNKAKKPFSSFSKAEAKFLEEQTIALKKENDGPHLFNETNEKKYQSLVRERSTKDHNILEMQLTNDQKKSKFDSSSFLSKALKRQPFKKKRKLVSITKKKLVAYSSSEG